MPENLIIHWFGLKRTVFVFFAFCVFDEHSQTPANIRLIDDLSSHANWKFDRSRRECMPLRTKFFEIKKNENFIHIAR